jgi:hypothetical protein
MSFLIALRGITPKLSSHSLLKKKRGGVREFLENRTIVALPKINR